MGVTAHAGIGPIGQCGYPAQHRTELVSVAAQLLQRAALPVVLVADSLVRAGAQEALLNVAEKARAVVLTTPNAKGAFPWDHPLSGRTWTAEHPLHELAVGADLVLTIGAMPEAPHIARGGPVGQWTATLMTLDAEPGALEGLAAALTPRAVNGVAEQFAIDVLRVSATWWAARGSAPHCTLLRAVRTGVPDDAVTLWDRSATLSCAWPFWDARAGSFSVFPLPAGPSSGREVPDAIPPRSDGTRMCVVTGDTLQDPVRAALAEALQRDLPLTWLITSEERERDASARAVGALVTSLRPGRLLTATADSVEEALGRTWTERGLRVIHLRESAGPAGQPHTCETGVHHAQMIA